MALKTPVTDKTYAEAKSDVEAAGGKVTYEFRSAFKALLVSLPSQEITAFSTKPYVEFIEEDKSGKTLLIMCRYDIRVLIFFCFVISSYCLNQLNSEKISIKFAKYY
jgi:hypothetical protein